MPAQRAKDRVEAERVTFERGLRVHLFGIDGTWTRGCTLDDISQTGAKLTLADPPDEAALKEFFLLLSMSGLAYRRCELTWVNGDKIGVNFILPEDRKPTVARRSTDE